MYPNFVPFTVDYVMKRIGLYIFHGLAPSTQVEIKFQSRGVNEVNGFGFIHEAFGERAIERRREFKAFLPLQIQ